MTTGLCQALAFHSEKASKGGDRGEAHEYILLHTAKIMGLENNALQEARDSDTMTYMHHTRRVLSAWVYFKRFAESALTVDKKEQK